MNKPSKNKSHPQQPNHQGDFIHAQRTTIYKGQLPPPEMLERFEALELGFTNRLLTMVEDESKFKRDYDKRALDSFKLSTILGIVAAFLAVVIIAAVAVYALYGGYDTAAATIMSTCVVGVIVAFLQRRKRNKEE